MLPTFLLNFDMGGAESSSPPPQWVRPGRFTPRKKSRYPLHRRLGGPCGRSGRVSRKKNLLLSAGFELRTVQHVTSRHTQYVIPATSCNLQGSVSWNPRRSKLYYLCANMKQFF